MTKAISYTGIMEFQLPNRPEFTGMIYIRKIYIQKEIIVQVSKWGNSLAAPIPKAFVKEAHVAHGTPVDLWVDDGRIVITPHSEPEYRLEDLLRAVTRGNRHAGIETGGPVGREVR